MYVLLEILGEKWIQDWESTNFRNRRLFIGEMKFFVHFLSVWSKYFSFLSETHSYCCLLSQLKIIKPILLGLV